MSVISIRRFLLGGEAGLDRDGALLRGLRLLLDGLTLHAVEGDRSELDAFQTELNQLCARLTPEAAPEDILVVVGSVLKSLENYNRKASAFMRCQTAELQSIVGMLTHAVTVIATGQERSVGRLQEIGKQVERAAASDNIRLMKSQLAECLAALQEEAARHRQESSQLVEGLREGIDAVKVTASRAAGQAIDAITMLPARAEAEQALAEAIRAGGTVYAAAFVLERVQSVNARFGFSAGNRMLVAFKKWIEESLPYETLFRWSGPAFLVLLERDAPIDFVRSELGRICDKKLEVTVENGERTLMLPVSAAFTVMPMLASAKLVAHKLDAFIATHFRQKE